MSHQLSKLSLLIALSITLLAYWLFLQSPVHFNPDASAYFGMALRFSRGQFLGAAHLMHSPLLSLFIAMISLFGAPLITAYHIFASVLTGAIFLASSVLARSFECSRVGSIAIALLVVFQIFPFALLTITPDVLVVLIVELIFIALLKYESSAQKTYLYIAGFLIGLSYLAKAFQLPIYTAFLAIIAVYRLSYKKDRMATVARDTLIIAGVALLTALPWIITISAKADAITISGQQWVMSGEYDLLYYHPDLPLEFAKKHIDPTNIAESLQKTIASNLSSRIAIVKEILSQLITLSVSELTLLILAVLILFMLKSNRFVARVDHRHILFLIYIACHTLLYIFIGGPYARFYLPVLAILTLLLGGTILKFKSERPSFYKILTLLIFLSASLHVLLRVREIVSQPNDPRIAIALSVAELRQDSRPLIGNLDAPQTGYVAYMLNRESWGYLTPGEFSTGTAQQKLERWQVSQVLWFGTAPDELMRAPYLNLVHDSGVGIERVLVFNSIKK